MGGKPRQGAVPKQQSGTEQQSGTAGKVSSSFKENGIQEALRKALRRGRQGSPGNPVGEGVVIRSGIVLDFEETFHLTLGSGNPKIRSTAVDGASVMAPSEAH